MNFSTFSLLSAVALVAVTNVSADGSNELSQVHGLHADKPDKPDFNFGFLRGGSRDSNCNTITSKSAREDCKSRKRSNKDSSGSMDEFDLMDAPALKDTSDFDFGILRGGSRDSNCNTITSKSAREDCKSRKRSNKDSSGSMDEFDLMDAPALKDTPDFGFGILRGGSRDSNCNTITSKSAREDCKSRKRSNKDSSGSMDEFDLMDAPALKDTPDFDFGILRGGSRDSNCNTITSKSAREDCKSRKRSNKDSSSSGSMDEFDLMDEFARADSA